MALTIDVIILQKIKRNKMDESSNVARYMMNLDKLIVFFSINNNQLENIVEKKRLTIAMMTDR